ncbi:hypothetical protein ABIB90_007795 [Bradyrhizobium sp. JR4.1]|nr:hypothetical protein Bra1253DRAFT_07087 [Bradyrhizobium sp. WSM1253]
MILILLHHTAHLSLTHTVHIHSILATLPPGRPISVDPCVLGALTV